MTDEAYMQIALDLASAAKGQTSPNPTVGALVVKDGEVKGFGAHLKAGSAHAEVHALQMAGSEADGSTLYVTLEPCSHDGKTPPCTDLIIEKRVKRVVIATEDPNPKVAGNGIKKLRDANIDVDIGILHEQAQHLNQNFFHYIKTNTPYVTLKTAASLDGKIATSTGESKWITGREARLDVHDHRHEHDAILVGIGTVLKDDPLLTTRRPNGGKHPIRIVLDHRLRTPLHSRIIRDDSAETWIVTGGDVSEEQKSGFRKHDHVTLIEMAGGIVIAKLMPLLAKRGVTSILVEGGATINEAFLVSRFIHRVVVYLAPKLIGGSEAPTPIGGNGFRRLEDAFNLHINSVEKIGDDIKIVATPCVKNGSHAGRR